MKKLLEIPIRFPKWSLAFFTTITILLGLGIPKLEVRNSFDGELPTTDPINMDIEAVKEKFDERRLVMLGISSDDLYTTESMNALANLTEEIKAIPDVLVDEVMSLASVDNISNRSWGMHSEGFLDNIPKSSSEWNQLKQDISANKLVNGKLISEDGTLAIIVAPLDEGFQGGEVYDALQRLKSNFSGSEKLYISGAPIMVEDMQRGISNDSKRFIGIAVFVILIGFFICFRSWIGVLLPLSMVLMSIVWTMGAMGYLGLNITVVSNALPVIMIAVASSYGIHYINALLGMAGQFESREEWLRACLDKIGFPILFTGITSGLGSLSLLVFNIQSLKEFGVIGAIGFFFATFICLGFLTSICMLIKLPKRAPSKQLNTSLFTLWLSNRVIHNKPLFVLMYAIGIPFFIWQAMQVKIGDDYMKFFPSHHEGRIAAERFSEKLNGIRVMNLMVNADKEDGLKSNDFFERLKSFEAEIEALGFVGGVSSYTDMVEHISSNYESPENESLDASQIAQYLMLFEMSANPGEIESLYNEDYSSAHVQVLLATSDPEVHKHRYTEIQAIANNYFNNNESVRFGGDVMHRIALGNYIVEGKIQNILLTLFIVFLTTFLLFKNLRKSLFTLLPIVLSLLMVFGCMGMVGIRLGISTSLLTAMIVGIGIDFAIHYLVAYYRSGSIIQTASETGSAISYDALSNVIGFSVLSFSGFLPVQHFGWLLAFSMLLIYLNTMIIYPLFFSKARTFSINTLFQTPKIKTT